jgi:hypothetical protein
MQRAGTVLLFRLKMNTGFWRAKPLAREYSKDRERRDRIILKRISGRYPQQLIRRYILLQAGPCCFISDQISQLWYWEVLNMSAGIAKKYVIFLRTDRM